MLKPPFLKTRYADLYNDDGLPSSHETQGDENYITYRGSRRTKIICDILGALALGATIFIFWRFASRPPVYFRLDDPSIMYPRTETYVNTLWVILTTFALPILVVTLFYLFLFGNVWDLYAGVYGVILAWAIALLFTSALWNFVGGIRPWFLSVCDVDYSRVTSMTRYYTPDICRNRDDLSRSFYQSFPSGHASTAWAGSIFLASYLASHMKVYRNGNVLKTFLVLLPLICATWLATSRWVDHYHTPLEIIVGVLIGIFAGLLAYRLTYVHGGLLGYGKWAHVPWVRYADL